MKVRTLLKHMKVEVDEVEIYTRNAALSNGKSSPDTFRSLYADCKVDYFGFELDEKTGIVTLVIRVKDPENSRV